MGYFLNSRRRTMATSRMVAHGLLMLVCTLLMADRAERIAPLGLAQAEGPPGPTGAVAVVGIRSVTVSWNNTPGATSYTLYLGLDAALSPSHFTARFPNVTNPTPVNGLENGTTYYFIVTAMHGARETLPSNLVSATTPAPPSAASGLTATAAGSGEIDLAWVDNSSNEDGFSILRGTDGVAFAPLTSVPVNATTYADTTVVAGMTYYYEIVAFNAVGSADPSNVASATTKLPPWRPVTSGTTADLRGLSSGLPHLWAVGSGGTILHSPDSGQTWSPQSSGTSNGLWRVTRPFGTTLWAVGDSGTVLRSLDLGATWTALVTGTTTNLRASNFVSNTIGWAVGEGGTILYTNDGGNTWTAQTSGTTATLLAVNMFDAQHGLMAGDGGTMIRTSDGGATWTPQASGTTNRLRGLSFAGPLVGWATGDQGTILHTADGGFTWIAQTSNTTNSLSRATAIGPSILAVGDLGTILAGTNGTWVAQTSGTLYNLQNLVFAGPAQGWVVGDHGTILVTTSGGF
jgi:photosystem II stability/assembly factor-like uncharacterized protein